MTSCRNLTYMDADGEMIEAQDEDEAEWIIPEIQTMGHVACYIMFASKGDFGQDLLKLNKDKDITKEKWIYVFKKGEKWPELKRAFNLQND